MRLFSSFLLFLQCILILGASALASEQKKYRVRGTVVPNEVLDNVSSIHTNARVVVNGGEHYGYINKDGTFYVDNVKLGDSLLEISSMDYGFPKIHLRITLNEAGRASIAARYIQTGSEWSEDTPTLAYPLRTSAKERYNFFTPRKGFSIISMFSNPYMLMVGFSLVAVFILPKLQANMDPEALKEMQGVKK